MPETGRLHAQGKVRDVYRAGEDALLLVATDRISAFDVILPNSVPDKGRVLSGLSLYWFAQTRGLVANHLLSADPLDWPQEFRSEPELAGRAMLVRRAEVVPLECVARGYLSGSGWKQYKETGTVCGVPLPSGLIESDRLAEPIFTPTTKATEGHDLPLTPAETEQLVGKGLAERLKELTLTIYERAAEIALGQGLILADTKFEFGFSGGELILVDEVLTPDSSRFWPADGYAPGRPQPAFDKQFVRDWLEDSAWNKEPPPPELPPGVVEATAARYREAYERLVGEGFDAYLSRFGIASNKEPGSAAADLDRIREGRSQG